MTWFISVFFLVMHVGCATTVVRKHHQSVRITKPSELKARVVIDAGHGGEDSGAVGRRGLLEKDISLDIAKRLQRLFLHHMPNVEVSLTRTTDEYVSLERRVEIANTKNADLFISLHVNSSESKEAGGYEIFSLDVASDRHSERLAARENKSKGGSNRVDFILADLRAYSNRSESDRLASYISQGLRGQMSKSRLTASVNDRGYNQAIFQVLFVKMPAVLTELMFISNPKEEQVLASKTAREQIARGIMVGMKKFLDEKVLRAENDRSR